MFPLEEVSGETHPDPPNQPPEFSEPIKDIVPVMLGPNITGNLGSPNTKTNPPFVINGAFTQSDAKWSVSGDNDLFFYNTAFNASSSNPIYGKSNTVQPPTLAFNYIVKY